MAIYLDFNATAPVRVEVVETIREIMNFPANPSSVHSFGRAAKKHLEDARKTIADSISCWPDEIIFTSSGTEANVTALRNAPGNILVSSIEHSSILKNAGEGVATLSVDSNGVVNFAALEEHLKKKPALVSVMLANNETGVIQPIAEIAGLCKKHDALLHCDAVQALGKIPVDCGTLGVDMLTISAHKCGGPVGAAALTVRRSVPFKALLAGGQESRRRAGTENVAAICGFAKAVELIDLDAMNTFRTWLSGFEKTAIEFGGKIFGVQASRLPNTSCVAMPGVTGEVQLMDFDLNGFAVSAGSACSSGRVEVSHVLMAMGVPEAVAKCAIRVSLGWNSRKGDIEAFTKAWKTTCERLASKGQVA